MKRLLMLACAGATLLAPAIAAATDPPKPMCTPSLAEPMCQAAVAPLLLPSLQCELCSEAAVVCESLRTMPLLSMLPACDPFADFKRSTLAGDKRTAM
jgi:hypothetical protein